MTMISRTRNDFEILIYQLYVYIKYMHVYLYFKTRLVKSRILKFNFRKYALIYISKQLFFKSLLKSSISGDSKRIEKLESQ